MLLPVKWPMFPFRYVILLAGFLLPGCADRYIDHANSRISHIPVISRVVPQKRITTFSLGAHASQSTFDTLLTRTEEDRPNNYTVVRKRASAGTDIGIHIPTGDGTPGKISMADLFAHFEGDPYRIFRNNTTIIGGGVTTSFPDFRFRIATGIGRHQYDIRSVLVVDPFELCSQNCETTFDTISENESAPLFVWSATIWPTPYERGAFEFAPYIGFQYGFQFISGQSSTYAGSLSLRNPIVSLGVQGDWGSTAITGEVHGENLYNAHSGISGLTAEIRVEQSFRIQKSR